MGTIDSLRSFPTIIHTFSTLDASIGLHKKHESLDVSIFSTWAGHDTFFGHDGDIMIFKMTLCNVEQGLPLEKRDGVKSELYRR